MLSSDSAMSPQRMIGYTISAVFQIKNSHTDVLVMSQSSSNQSWLKIEQQAARALKMTKITK